MFTTGSLPILQLETPAATTATPLLNPRALPQAQTVGLYVHVPFCSHKCHYCDFYSITRQGVERMRRFVDRVLVEAQIWSDNPGPICQPRTIFFGGGTPTLLPADVMLRLIEGLRRRFDFSQLHEFTVEANPASVSLEYCQMLRSVGVNRISFGAQSFDPRELARLERHHHPDDVPRSIKMARQAGFDRINIDLIYAIPGQSLDSWASSLDRAIALGLRHYSCYGLTYEPNTPLAVKKRLGQIQAVPEELELSMLHLARRRLTEVGCPPYEISNYAAAGQHCQHNLVYWTGQNYIGLGPAAASHIQGYRFRNRPHLGEWEQAIDAGILPAGELEVLSPLRRAGELVMLQLRLTRGVEFADFAGRSGYDARQLYADQLDRLGRAGLLQIDESGFRLTEAGLNVADAIAAEFLTPQDR